MDGAVVSDFLRLALWHLSRGSLQQWIAGLGFVGPFHNFLFPLPK